MWYIEYLRARRALTVYGIIIAAMVVLAMIVRITVHIDGVPKNHPPVHTPIDFLAVIVGFMIAILGTVLATSLSSHVNGHLEIAWTKPIPRDRLVGQTFAVDIGALFVAYVATIVVLVGINAAYNAHLDVSLVQLGHVLAEFAFPVAMYAFVQATTASMSRRGGMIAGLSWPILLLLSGIIHAPVPEVVHAVLVALNYLNPLTFISASMNHGQSVNALGLATWSTASIADALSIVALGFVLSLLQWRRMEA